MSHTPSPPIGRSSIPAVRSGGVDLTRIERSSVVDDLGPDHPHDDADPDVDLMGGRVVVAVVDDVADRFLERQVE